MGCNNFQNERTDQLVEASMRGENSGIQSCSSEIRAEWDKVGPAVEEKLRAMDEAEEKSKEDLVKQSKEAEHIHIEASPEDYPKAVHAISIKGFENSEIISDAEMKARIKDDPMMQVHERFFPGKMTSEEYTDKREIRYIMKGGNPEVGPVLGATKIDPKTGEKQVKINEHRIFDAIRHGFITKEDAQKATREERNQATKKVLIGTHFHEIRAHIFGEDMLGKEAQNKLGDLFKDAKVKGEEAFVTPYAKKNKWEYLGEGAAWYSDPGKQQELAKKDPGLYNYIKETEEECKQFLAISKNLILVRGGER